MGDPHANLKGMKDGPCASVGFDSPQGMANGKGEDSDREYAIFGK